MSDIFLWTCLIGVIVRKSIFGQISLKCFATGPDFFVFMFKLCSVNRSCNFLLVSPTYMALQFEHFIAYTTPFDWQLQCCNFVIASFFSSESQNCNMYFSVHTTHVLPKSLSGSGPIPCQGLGEGSCSICGNNQNYSIGHSSTYSGTLFILYIDIFILLFCSLHIDFLLNTCSEITRTFYITDHYK